MARPKTYQPDTVADAAMLRFWYHGYNGSAISDLVQATGVNRHGLYQTFNDKQGLFAAAAQRYSNQIVTPALEQVETPGAGVAEIRSYFHQQIALAEDHGLPGPGCLMANTTTETGPHDPAVAALVKAHLDRLTAAFRNALQNTVHPENLDDAAWFITVSAQGLWSVSRTTATSVPLYAYVEQLLTPFEETVT